MSCKKGMIRNPRTARCVKGGGLLGRTITAATQALASGTAPTRACGGASRYDYATATCVSDARAAVLAELERRARLERRVSDANAASAAKNLTSRMFDAVRAKNYQETVKVKNSNLRLAQGDAVQLFGMVEGLQAQLADCNDRLRRTQQRERQLTNALLKNSGR